MPEHTGSRQLAQLSLLPAGLRARLPGRILRLLRKSSIVVLQLEHLRLECPHPGSALLPRPLHDGQACACLCCLP